MTKKTDKADEPLAPPPVLLSDEPAPESTESDPSAEEEVDDADDADQETPVWYDAKWFRDIKLVSVLSLVLATGFVIRGCITGEPPPVQPAAPKSESPDKPAVEEAPVFSIPSGGSPDSPFRKA